MDISYSNKDKLLTVKITEEIDHHAVEKIRRRVDNEIQRHMPKRVIFDFSNVSFMDSSGIGMVVGRYKLISMLGGSLVMKNVKPNLEKVFKMSGILKIIPIEQDESISKRKENVC